MIEPLTLREYQRLAQRSDVSSGIDSLVPALPLLGLAGEVGSLLTEYKKFLREGDRYKPFSDQVAEEIGDVLWYLASIATKAGLDLEEIAHENLAKLEDRWPVARDEPMLISPRPPRYDEAFPPTEQLPRRVRVEFREVATDGRLKLELRSDGKPIGDWLTDNAHTDDGYRYHDVFHLANAILLGWSPVTRKLLGVKRKSNDRIDEVEDGARAMIMEEAVSAVVFGYAKDHSFFERAESIDYELLKTVRSMTQSFEVRNRTLRDWEKVILDSFAVWRLMVAHRGGAFVGDSDAVEIHYEKLPVNGNH